MPERRSVQIRAEVYDKIVPTIFEATGIKPNLTEFVTDAVAEKLANYENKQANSTAGKNRKAV